MLLYANMKVTNLMEDYVRAHVDDLYKRLKEEKISWLTCDCDNCRMDTQCYVLNRIPPKYTISGRGINHVQAELDTMKQVMADVETLAMEGIRIISGSKRPNHSGSYVSSAEIVSGKSPFFFFPIFSGAVYDGTTFESLSNAEITILYKNKPAKMLDSTWQNPCRTFSATEGAYNFCVEPEKAKKEGITQNFSFELTIKAPGYETVNYAFSIPVESKVLRGPGVRADYSLKIQDLFLFPEGMVNPMERYPVSN